MAFVSRFPVSPASSLHHIQQFSSARKEFFLAEISWPKLLDSPWVWGYKTKDSRRRKER